MDLTAILYAFSYSEYKIMKKKSNDMGLSITCPRVIVFDRLNYIQLISTLHNSLSNTGETTGAYKNRVMLCDKQSNRSQSIKQSIKIIFLLNIYLSKETDCTCKRMNSENHE